MEESLWERSGVDAIRRVAPSGWGGGDEGPPHLRPCSLSDEDRRTRESGHPEPGDALARYQTCGHLGLGVLPAAQRAVFWQPKLTETSSNPASPLCRKGKRAQKEATASSQHRWGTRVPSVRPLPGSVSRHQMTWSFLYRRVIQTSRTYKHTSAVSRLLSKV